MSISEKPNCGIIMPISPIDGCNEAHWADVLSIHSDAISDAGFDPRLVSSADEVSLIHKTIVQNIYNDPIVVCDVSCKNPNVMFELGLRLAFDKSVIIVKDDQTEYSFDTSLIEHLNYPRDLRFSKMVDFKRKLTDKIKATHKRAISDPDYSPFLKHFGEFVLPQKLDQKEVTGQEFLLSEIKSIKEIMFRMYNSPIQKIKTRYPYVSLELGVIEKSLIPEAMRLARAQFARINDWIIVEHPGGIRLDIILDYPLLEEEEIRLVGIIKKYMKSKVNKN